MAKFFISLIVIASLGIMTAETSQAQNQLTLEDCIEIALANRATIIRARGDKANADAGSLAALGAFLPRVSAAYSYTKGKETDIEPPNVTVLDGDTVVTDEQDIGPNKRWSASANMNILNISNVFAYAASRANVERAELNVLASEQALIFSVKTAYYAYLAAIEAVTVQEQAVERAEEQLKLIQSRFDLGSASKSDVLRQRVQYGNDRLALLQAQNAVIQTKADLAYVIGLNPQAEHEFSANYQTSEISGTLDDVIDFGLTNNPDLLAQDATLTQASRVVKSVYASYLPDLSLFANYQRFNGTQAFPFTFDFSSNQYTYGFRVDWNVFDGFSREARLTDAKVFRNNSRAALADQRNLTISNIKTAYVDIERIKEQVEVAEENVAAAEEDLKITQERYNLGAATILDLLESQEALTQAQVQLIQATFDLNLAIARLERAMGKR